MCSCLFVLLHVCGVHNSKFDINIRYSVACVSVVAIKTSVNGRIGGLETDRRTIEDICIEFMRPN